MITDTQVLSYYFKGTISVPSAPVRISSVTAAEFLLVQSRIPTRANYYPILPSYAALGEYADVLCHQAKKHFSASSDHPIAKQRTDQLILEFGSEMPTYIEFGSIALTQLINQRLERLFLLGLSHLDKRQQRTLRERFRFLGDIDVECVAATVRIAGMAMNLLSMFLERYQPKQNIRNTCNDVLILATAIAKNSPLISNDKLLVRFAAEIMNAPRKHLGNWVITDFSAPSPQVRRTALESKGYIQRGWQVRERRCRTQKP